MGDLEAADLVPGVRVLGLSEQGPATITRVEALAGDNFEVTHRDDLGQVGFQVMAASDLGRLPLEPVRMKSPTFAADPNEFRFAAQALDLKYAATRDPMIAVHSSQIDPLPHQLQAVYSHLLPKFGLRFLLADDPGAGKTIMAGLYVKEMILRERAKRVIIVAPGGLVDQWHDELSEKFDLHFEVLDKEMIQAARDQNVFALHPRLLVRMDMVARNDDLLAELEGVHWDIAVVDEAHRMSASYSSWRGEAKETRRFQLGRVLSDRSNNFLLMTATPHAGKDEDFQLFMSLLDRDMFEGKYRPGVHSPSTEGLMRRVVKEDLLTFEGAPLFPERHAYTVTYDLSPGERELYRRVTDYVRTEMGRADRISQEGDQKRGNTIGFALTVLQRRLASSPYAIYRSLVRRKERLTGQLAEFRDIARGDPQGDWRITASLPRINLKDAVDEDFEDLSPAEQARLEEDVDEVVSMATAARTIPELEAEIATLGELVDVADDVRKRGEDKKWVQLRRILDQEVLSTTSSGDPRKLIIFTEHRDTLDYLHGKIGDMLGDPEAVVVIHGGLTHSQRKTIQEKFTSDPRTQVLIGTDAAGEGLNLQRAHLMVNYDLPWNPNRIEQRFGRIHRIGQGEVCHLWNLVAADTREGAVFTRLLEKVARISEAYSGKLFDVLGKGDVFDGLSLRDLMIEAIRYGDRPEVRERQSQAIDKGIARGLKDLDEEKETLAPEAAVFAELDSIEASVEAAQEHRLNPKTVADFFVPAFERLGGSVVEGELGRYWIGWLPPRVVAQVEREFPGAPADRMRGEVTFDPENVLGSGELALAQLIAPGSPLLAATIALTLQDLSWTLEQGTVFVDRSPEPRKPAELSYLVEQRILNGTNGQVLSQNLNCVSVDEDGQSSLSDEFPFFSYDVPNSREQHLARLVLSDPRFHEDHPVEVLETAYSQALALEYEDAQRQVEAAAERTRELVRKRLLAEINRWYTELSTRRAEAANGGGDEASVREAENRIKRLEKRLRQRTVDLEDSRRLRVAPPEVKGVAAVVPVHLLEAAARKEKSIVTLDTETVDRRAVDAVLKAERALGRDAQEMEHSQKGYDVKSLSEDGTELFIEVKGRIQSRAREFSITASQVDFANEKEGCHRLALVVVSEDGPELDEVRYIGHAFNHLQPVESTRAFTEDWNFYWEKGRNPY